MGISFKNHLQQQKNETPDGGKNNKDVIYNFERSMSIKDASIKEENAKFDGSVCDLFEDEGRVNDL